MTVTMIFVAEGVDAAGCPVEMTATFYFGRIVNTTLTRPCRPGVGGGVTGGIDL